MKIFHFINRNLFNIFLFLYSFLACVASINTGITHDERFDLHTFILNKNIISNFFLNTNLNTEYLYGEKAFMTAFYGIGFHFFSYPIEQLLNFIDLNLDLSKEGKLQIIKHPSIIILFVISGIYFKKIILILTSNKSFSSLATFFYLLYPYLIGHSFFNIKDSPFMSVWLICTFFIINIVKDFVVKEKISLKKICLLGILTSFLISIRIFGVLIFVEYLIFIIFLLSNTKNSTKFFLKKIYKSGIIFFVITFAGIYLLSPHFWNKPETIFSALNFFKNHIQTVCTITLGKCIEAQDLSPTYLPIWFFFKLPILILLGLIVFPFVDKKIFRKPLDQIIIGSLICTFLFIILLIFFSNAIIYDEIRHVIFLVPLILIISFASLFNFFSKKILITSILFYIFFFSFQNLKIFPYNYLWLNNFSSFLNVSSNFELDYWGASTRNVSDFFKNEKINKSNCIISNRNEGLKYFLYNSLHDCFIDFKMLDKKIRRPFYAVLLERKINKGLPDGCKEIHTESINLNFSKEKIVLARIYECI